MNVNDWIGPKANHLGDLRISTGRTAQHYLTHLLLPALVRSDTDGNSRIVVVSSGAIRRVTDPSVLEKDLLAGSGADGNTGYSETKFVQLLGAHWWRRKLAETSCKVVAVSPGLIPGTGIGRGSGMVLTMDMQDAKTVEEGESNFRCHFCFIGVAARTPF